MKIMSFDPGVTTGMCFLSTPGDRPSPSAFMHAQLATEMVWTTLDFNKPDLVVYEGFYWRQGKTKIDFTPVEVIGIIKEWCRQHDVDYFEQTPSEGKHFFDDERLVARDLYVKGQPHANDATRHLLYFLEFGKGKAYGHL